MSDTSFIRFERRAGLGIVVLDRPQALNALTREMVAAFSARLAAWKDDPAIKAVLVKKAAGRAFCAGGDIRAVAGLARAEGPAAAMPFFVDEYRLNWRIKRLPKPYIALLDGITMGGGVGISVHGSHRIVTENTVFAMPETGIGFFPDVGGSHVLPRLAGESGTWLGLTGTRLGAADMLGAGIGTHHVAANRLSELEADLASAGDGGEIAGIIERHASPLEGGDLAALRARIDACFAGATMAEIVAALAAEPTGFGSRELATLRAKSPLAVHATLALLRRGRSLDLEACLVLEHRMAYHFLAGHDFAEGVRALLVDKDRKPCWAHPDLDAVRPDEVEALLAPFPDGDLRFDWESG